MFAALALYWAFPPETFPFQSVDDATTTNNRFNLEPREILGDTEGPFKWAGAITLNSGVAPKRTIRYQIDGSEKRYVVPAKLDGVELTAQFFENPKRNILVLLYARQSE